MDLFAIAGMALIAAVLSVMLRQYRPEFSVLIGFGAGILILLYVLSKAQPAFSELTSLFSRAQVSSSYAVILLKALGICFITQLACDACSDAGEHAIASKIELAGKFAVLLVALPLFEEIAKLAISLLD